MNKHLLVLLCTTVALTYGAPGKTFEWITHASHAEADQVPAGQSRFDELFRTANGQHHIPYPFESLLEALESRIDNGNENGVRQVLIPIGRSLQRNAAAPDFFGNPRVVAALQGEPRSTGAAAQSVLEYRLFIAHQPQSHNLEIISYNDDAGRFEFQVVDDYRAGGKAQLRQANRAMCLGCHQNAGPIFPTRPWSETNFNFRIARRLSERHPQRYESFVAALGSDADSIDLLADRANYLAAAQFVWRQACPDTNCRAAALRALLQYRLSGEAGFERDHDTYRDHYLDRLHRSWAHNWSQGLALASSRIVDRDPLDGSTATRHQDPLSLRPPHAYWKQFDDVLADGIVTRLAGFLTLDDIRRIDQHLIARAQYTAQPVQQFSSHCRLTHVGLETRLVECSDSSLANAPKATLELDYRDGAVQSLHLLSLRMPGDPGILQPSVSRSWHLQDGIKVELQNTGGLSMRLANGDRLNTLSLQWQEADLRGDIRLELSLIREFEPIDRALKTMLQQHDNQRASSLERDPFRRREVLSELGRALGTELLPDIPAINTARPARSVATTATSASINSTDQDLYLLQAHCAQCHGRDTRQPPGFLTGKDAGDRITACAPRILARLRAWQTSQGDSVTPMPPPASVAPDWAKGEHYPRLLATLERMLENEGQGQEIGTEIAAYQQLDSCLGED